jgi:hypothetical protein
VSEPRLTKQEAVKALSDKIEAIGTAVEAAREFADDYSLPFSLTSIDLYTDTDVEDNGWNSSNC